MSLADPEDQAERERIAEVDVAQDRERQAVLPGIVVREGRGVRHDRDELRAELADFVMDRRQRAQFELAVGAPVSAIEADDGRAGAQQRGERDELSALVRQIERGQRLADLRADRAAVQHVEPRHQLVIGLRDVGADAQRAVPIGGEPRAERRIAAFGLDQGFGQRGRRASTIRWSSRCIQASTAPDSKALSCGGAGAARWRRRIASCTSAPTAGDSRPPRNVTSAISRAITPSASASATVPGCAALSAGISA